ncbi:AEC family transporter [Luethyella okanaganae]|uniref:AEC family transporter n=1 Tax=Luethyella okanaganae TaxID=69372 RepID=A0ABW1VGL8_9MICO
MTGVLTGFAVIGVAIVVGYLVGRTNVLGPHARAVLSRLVFFVLSPFLLFSVLATADVRTLFSALLPVSAFAAIAMFAIFSAIALLVWRRRLAETVIGSLASGYVNGNNMGIPIALYMLGDAAFAAPIVLVQLLVFTPIALAILDARVNGSTSMPRILAQTFRNPIIIGSLAGLLVALSGLSLPAIVLDPIELIGHAAVPIMLISFGMSLSGQRLLRPGSGRRDILTASTLKLVFMPLAAWALGAFVFGLESHALYVVTVLATLPTAQNVFNYSQRYGVAEIVARDTVFITTIGCVPVLFVVSLFLG